MNNKQKHWDDMYDRPLENIPWEIKDPPKELVELIEHKVITNGRALDIACGTGNYSFYLAEHGFSVVGVDFSKKALAIAEQQAKQNKLPVTFIYADVTKLADFLPNEQFDFILDYSILHHIDPQLTNSYANQYVDLLKPGGKLLLVCYSEKYQDADTQKTGQGAKGKYGNDMFFRTADEIRTAYKTLHELSYHECRLGKRGQHPAHCFVFEKR